MQIDAVELKIYALPEAKKDMEAALVEHRAQRKAKNMPLPFPAGFALKVAPPSLCPPKHRI